MNIGVAKQVMDLQIECQNMMYKMEKEGFHELKKHTDENGNVCTCCLTADSILTHSVIASAIEHKKIEDVIHMITAMFSWGISVIIIAIIVIIIIIITTIIIRYFIQRIFM